MRQYKSESDPTKNQAVNGDADGIAGKNTQPLISFGDAALPQMVDLGVNQLTEDFGDNTGEDNSPNRPEYGGKLFSQSYP